MTGIKKKSDTVFNRDEIVKRLKNFVGVWKDYKKTERTGAQSFLQHFFQAFGIEFSPNNLPYELTFESGNADCYIEHIVIIEMKDPNKYNTIEKLKKALPQAQRYNNDKKIHPVFSFM